jgi:hypothetical protein
MKLGAGSECGRRAVVERDVERETERQQMRNAGQECRGQAGERRSISGSLSWRKELHTRQNYDRKAAVNT